ncbi:D-aminoacyl-tRNA deacylase [Thermosulfurimonas sp. F29]|uniref:D-aminoacyl-tRNA deacylase n=1 Tax=Thermosulfurimonas sp. F29 TaxID=2867247 RepID=UPI001C82E83E|nr:D-aminoacyl-tRNA deacylase [Thermosulfurimonas sp. F29]MBX6422578.1 D-tyrosyl-tRNA(Tyr) deacylase [Thermosulfurimonas sp. F29]
MRAVIQRVKEATVRVEGKEVARIGRGFLVLVGVEKGDGPGDLDWMAGKIAGLRLFEDEAGRMNHDLSQVGGEVLLVSNFTLCGDCRKGKRPSFDPAERPERARELCEALVKALSQKGLSVKTGVFGAYMQVELINDGPVTVILDSRKRL